MGFYSIDDTVLEGLRFWKGGKKKKNIVHEAHVAIESKA